MSVYYSQVADSFEKHFLELSTKAESIHPFFAPNAVAKIFDEDIQGVDNILKKYENLLPLKKSSTKSSAQPVEGGLIYTNIFDSNGKKLIFTFEIKEVDTKDHRYGITANIITSYD